MSVFAQDGDGDLLLTNGQLTLLEGGDELAVRARNRLYSVKGEWFADASRGIPYLELILVKNPDLGVIRSVYSQAFSTLQGFASFNRLEVDIDKRTRELSVVTEIRHNSGAVIVGGSGEPFRVETT